ncbi:hypothetical protein V8Q34_22490 [Blautia sp. JLR.GB0024]|uniref:hypothetical protein n=1 Tax=Blautia sp. JLR.GB0024 TaxID=3123295 RepID=UPI0030040210
MRAISEMYMRSGGTASPRYCDECPNLTSIGKHYDYKLYQEAGGTKHWQPSWVACKFFGMGHLPGMVAPEEPEQEIDGQMSLFE